MSLSKAASVKSFSFSADDARDAKVLERVQQFAGQGFKSDRTVLVTELRGNHFVSAIDIQGEGDIDLEGVVAIPICTTVAFPSFDPTKFYEADESTLPADASFSSPRLYELVDEWDDESVGHGDLGVLKSKLIHREAEVYEILRHSPHENIVANYGCKVRNDRVIGFFNEKLFEPLLRRVRRLRGQFDLSACLDGLEKGLKHLHSLGLCHNKLKVENVMFRKNGCPVIIGLEYCLPIGENLPAVAEVKGYDSYYYKLQNDPEVISAVENDDHSLARIEELVTSELEFRIGKRLGSNSGAEDPKI